MVNGCDEPAVGVWMVLGKPIRCFCGMIENLSMLCKWRREAESEGPARALTDVTLDPREPFTGDTPAGPLNISLSGTETVWQGYNRPNGQCLQCLFATPMVRDKSVSPAKFRLSMWPSGEIKVSRCCVVHPISSERQEEQRV
jgi:hypothetical protein